MLQAPKFIRHPAVNLAVRFLAIGLIVLGVVKLNELLAATPHQTLVSPFGRLMSFAMAGIAMLAALSILLLLFATLGGLILFYGMQSILAFRAGMREAQRSS